MAESMRSVLGTDGPMSLRAKAIEVGLGARFTAIELLLLCDDDDFTASYTFDAAISADRRRRLRLLHREARRRLGACGVLDQNEIDQIDGAFDKAVRHGVETAANVNASVPSVGGDQIDVNFDVLFPQGFPETAQTIVHEVAHLAGFTHPMRCTQAGVDSGVCGEVDVPFDGGPYYDSVPLRAEMCIAGGQSDASCIEENGRCAIHVP